MGKGDSEKGGKIIRVLQQRLGRYDEDVPIIGHDWGVLDAMKGDPGLGGLLGF